MRKAKVLLHNEPAGYLEELEEGRYRFYYLSSYSGPAISLTIPVEQAVHEFSSFPAVFDGLLPEGVLLEALLRQNKIDRSDYLQQLIVVGADLVGAITVEPA